MPAIHASAFVMRQLSSGLFNFIQPQAFILRPSLGQLLSLGDHCVYLQVTVLKKLRAENIVRFLGVCVTPEHTMLVTEFMEAGDLFKALDDVSRRQELSWYKM